MIGCVIHKIILYSFESIDTRNDATHCYHYIEYMSVVQCISGRDISNIPTMLACRNEPLIVLCFESYYDDLTN